MDEINATIYSTMLNVNYPNNNRALPWFLAMEEHLASLPGEYLMLWQTRPTVIYGIHQEREAEVNIAWCKEHGVEVYQRKSGGGCVYSDEGNLMISYIRKGSKTDAQRIFGEYLDSLAGILRSLGLDAVTTANNDVLVCGKKVSGNACHATGDAVIVHGTLLINSNLDNVTAAITPAKEKMQRHAVASVRQRVANISEFGINDVALVKNTIIASLSHGTYNL